MSRIRLVAVLDVNVRHNARKHFLHWQHSSKLLPFLDLAVVSDGMNADQFYTVTWKRWERKVRKHQLHLLRQSARNLPHWAVTGGYSGEAEMESSSLLLFSLRKRLYPAGAFGISEQQCSCASV